MLVIIDRDTVHAGDDFPPDEGRELSDGSVLRDVARYGIRSMASIYGGRCSWVLGAGREPLAVVAHQSAETFFIAPAESKLAQWAGDDGVVRLFFHCLGPEEPEAVRDRLVVEGVIKPWFERDRGHISPEKESNWTVERQRAI